MGMPRLHLRPMLRLATMVDTTATTPMATVLATMATVLTAMATPMLDTATTTARGALMLRLIPPTSSTPMLDMLLMLMLLSSAPLLPTPTSTFLPQLPPTASPSSTSVRLRPMLRPDTTVDTTATTPTDTPTTDTDTVPMATTLMPTTTESRSAIIKLYTKVFLKMQCKTHTSGFIPTKPYKPIVRREFWILTLIQCKTLGEVGST